MTGRLAEMTARIEGMRQLGSVVNAMRGIAAGRAQHARAELAAVDSYAATLAGAIATAVSLLPESVTTPSNPQGRALVLFLAEQGFAGSFSEAVLDAAAEISGAEIFLIGTRGAAKAAERNIRPVWTSAMAAHVPAIPRLADRIAEAIYARIAARQVDRLDAMFAQWDSAAGVHIVHRRLFPLDTAAFPPPRRTPPLLNLPLDTIIAGLTADYVHALLCNAALHAFAAENEARVQAMASARRQIERQSTLLAEAQRRIKQEEITAEIIELASGASAIRT